jgi:hypothetical protein
MSSRASVEERLALLEKEVAQLKSRLRDGKAPEAWVDEVSGTFEGDEGFREILRLGKELRDAEPDEGEN